MRPIHLVRMDKVRPAVILTRERSRTAMSKITIAPITSNVRGLAVEVGVGSVNGLEHASVINLDGIQTVEVESIGRFVGFLHGDQEFALTKALIHAFDLRSEELPLR